MTASPAGLQAIRERADKRLNTVMASQDRRALLALYDAQSDEVRRLHQINVDPKHLKVAMQSLAFQLAMAEVMKQPSVFNEERQAALEAIRAALGSQP